MKTFLSRGGVLLGASAIVSKCLSLWRDRLFLDTFGQGETADLIFAAFRIPDFFFYLLIGGTVSTLLVPRMGMLDKQQQQAFFSSFLTGVLVLFGLVCGGLSFFTPELAELFAAGFEPALQMEVALLARWIFGSVFLIALSSVFSGYLQYHERFGSIALAPLLYVGTICGSMVVFGDQFGIQIIGMGAVLGAVFHLSMNAGAVLMRGQVITFSWLRPPKAWQHFRSDFLRRVLNSSAFQINQSADVLIASFLTAGSVAAFSIGSNLGHVLLTIVGYSLGNAVFPKLSKAKHNTSVQRDIVVQALKWIVLFCVPTAVMGAVLAQPVLQLLFGLEGQALTMTKTVFFWTVISLPAACAIPVLARVPLANDDTKTPLWITSFSLLVATGLAAYLSLEVYSGPQAVLGLALGNFTANFLSAGLFGYVVFRK